MSSVVNAIVNSTKDSLSLNNYSDILRDPVKGAKKAATVYKERTPGPGPAPIVMPTYNDEEVQKAKKRSIIEQMQRAGRASTFLGGSDTYSSDKLGG